MCLADGGNNITCLDIDEDKIAMLKKGESPIYEPGLTELLQKNKKHLHFTTDYPSALKDADVVFIAVGTPSGENGEANLTYVKSAAKSIGKHMTGDLVVVNRSTVPVGTGHEVEKIIQAETSYKISMISCPEFLREGCAIYDFMNPDRVVIGADAKHEKAVELLKDIYKGVNKNDAPFVVSDLRSAEMIKYASNSFLATQISYINDLAQLCQDVDVDITEVARGMKLDKRIGKHAFLSAGLGYGGSCFPKDVQALIALGKKIGSHLPLLEQVESVNESLVEIAFGKIKKLLDARDVKLENAKVAILGLSFKPNTDDIRDSQSVKLIGRLLRAGVSAINVVDPIVHWEKEVKRGSLLPKRLLDDKTSLGKITQMNGGDALEAVKLACKDADILILATEWNNFMNLQFEDLKKIMRNPCFADLRNAYSKKEVESYGFRVENMGRK